MDAALIQRVNSKLTDLAELQSREAATTLQRGWRQKRRAAAARRPPPAPSVSSLTGSLFGGRRDAPAPPAPKPETRQQEQWEKEGTALTPFALAVVLRPRASDRVAALERLAQLILDPNTKAASAGIFDRFFASRDKFGGGSGGDDAPVPVEVVLCLIRALSDEAAAVAAAAAAAAAALGLPELLQLAVTDERPQVRATAVLGIGALRREARSRMPPGLATLAPLAAALAAGGASDESMRGLVDAAAKVLKPLRCAPPLKVAPLIRALPRAGGPARAALLELVASLEASEVVADVALLDGDAAVRVEGVKQLGALGAVEPIAERALRDPDVRVRSAAVAALGELRQPAALTALALRDASAEVRILAVRWLGELGDEPALLEALRDAAPPVRIAALDAFAARKTAEPLLAAVASDAAPEVRAYALSRLPALGAAGAAASSLDDIDPSVRAAALEVLAESRAVQPLVERGLADADPRLRAQAVALLGSLGEPALAAALGDVDADVRVAAVEWLGRLRAAPPLLRALADPHPSVRLAAVQAATAAAASAAAHVVDDTRDALYQHGLPDAHGAVRLAAARALHRLGDPSWSGVIAGDAADAQRLGRSAHPAAASVLLRLMDSAARAGPAAVADGSSAVLSVEAVRALGDLPDAAGETLGTLTALASGAADLTMRTAALATVARLHPNDRAARAVVRRAMDDESADIRAAAAAAAASLADPATLRPLTLQLADRSEVAATAAARALGALADTFEEAMAALVLAIEQPLPPAVLDAAAEALGAMGAHSGELLDALARRYVERATQAEPRARIAVTRVLGRLSAQRAAELLNLLLASDRAAAVRGAAAAALGARASPLGLQPLATALRDKDASVVEAARRALLKLDYAPFARRGEAVARQGPVAPSGKIGGKKMPDVSMLLLLKPDDAPLADDESYDAPAARLLLVDGSGAATAVDRLAANADDVHLTVRLRGGKTKKLVTLVVPAREWAGEVGRAAG